LQLLAYCRDSAGAGVVIVVAGEAVALLPCWRGAALPALLKDFPVP
jgi:hypothetical protein